MNSVASNAKEWPDGVDLPDVIEVWLSAQDFEYYGLRRASCEKRIADAVIAYAEGGRRAARARAHRVSPGRFLAPAPASARSGAFLEPDGPSCAPPPRSASPSPCAPAPSGRENATVPPRAAQVQPAAAAAAQTPGASAAQSPEPKQRASQSAPTAPGKAAASNNPAQSA